MYLCVCMCVCACVCVCFYAYMYISNPDITQWHRANSAFRQSTLPFEAYEVLNLGSHSLEMGEYTLQRLNGDVWHRGLRV